MSVDDERLQIDNNGQTLRINSALVTDTSAFKCVATNIAGKDSKDFDLDVHGKFVGNEFCVFDVGMRK